MGGLPDIAGPAEHRNPHFHAQRRVRWAPVRSTDLWLQAVNSGAILATRHPDERKADGRDLQRLLRQM